jgi:hypothetical protein
MGDTRDASEAARQLVRARWGNQVVSRAVATIVERQDELTDAQRADLRQVTDQEDPDD